MQEFDESIWPEKIEKIDFKNKVILGGIPVSVLTIMETNTPPLLMQRCVRELCPSCDQEMWVRKKVICWRDTKPNVFIYCFPCIIVSARRQGIKYELMDVGSIN
jgi:hypothetical protein